MKSIHNFCRSFIGNLDPFTRSGFSNRNIIFATPKWNEETTIESCVLEYREGVPGVHEAYRVFDEPECLTSVRIFHSTWAADILAFRVYTRMYSTSTKTIHSQDSLIFIRALDLLSLSLFFRLSLFSCRSQISIIFECDTYNKILSPLYMIWKYP